MKNSTNSIGTVINTFEMAGIVQARLYRIDVNCIELGNDNEIKNIVSIGMASNLNILSHENQFAWFLFHGALKTFRGWPKM